MEAASKRGEHGAPPPADDEQQAAGAAGPAPPLPPSGQCATIVRHACDVLALPTRVVCTALTFLHRVNDEELAPERLAAACVFLAAKVEEASLRTNDMLNAVAAWSLGADADAIARFPCLVGDAYQQRKQQLIMDEQLLLRRLRFNIGVDQPHRHLYVLAHCWGASSEAMRTAVCLLNDCVSSCPQYGGASLQPATAAAAALHVAAQLCGETVKPSGWWRATGITDAEMESGCRALLDLLQA